MVYTLNRVVSTCIRQCFAMFNMLYRCVCTAYLQVTHLSKTTSRLCLLLSDIQRHPNRHDRQVPAAFRFDGRSTCCH